jgi:hypothetical protein
MRIDHATRYRAESVSVHQRNLSQVISAVDSHVSDQLCVSTVTLEEQIGGWSALARSAKSPHESAEEKTCTATPAASKGADDAGNHNSFVMQALRPPAYVAARRNPRREAACFRPGTASRPEGRKAAVHVVK